MNDLPDTHDEKMRFMERIGGWLSENEFTSDWVARQFSAP